jgi:hypothetical protein
MATSENRTTVKAAKSTALMRREPVAQAATVTRRWAAMNREPSMASDQALGDDLYCGDL